jgi:hypothetical protein
MRGQKRLEEIRQRFNDVLKDVSPESAERYEIRYEPMEKYHSDVIGVEVSVGIRQSPAYQFSLYDKSNPDKARQLMHVFGQIYRNQHRRI